VLFVVYFGGLWVLLTDSRGGSSFLVALRTEPVVYSDFRYFVKLCFGYFLYENIGFFRIRYLALFSYQSSIISHQFWHDFSLFRQADNL